MWTEKYRPKTLKDVFGGKKRKEILTKYVEAQDMPNLLFVGPNGVGKTATAFALKHEFKMNDRDFLFVKTSEERGIEVVRDKIANFARILGTSPTGWKMCLIDEADALTQQAQDALRSTMELYSKSIRFILTTNHLKKGRKGFGVGVAMQSRCAIFKFTRMHPATMKELLFKICLTEKCMLMTPVLDAIVDSAGGDVRLAINILEGVTKLDDPQPEDIIEMTGTPKEENVFALVFSALKGKISSLDRLDTLLKQGVDPMQITMLLYYGALRGSIPRITSKQRLLILKAIRSVPMSTPEQNAAGIIAEIILLRGIKEEE